MHVALQHHHVAERDPDPDSRQDRVGAARSEQVERERARHARRGGHEHHRVADALHDAGAYCGDHVAGRLLERREHATQLDGVQPLRERRVLGEIGEADREVHDARLRRALRCVAVPAPGRLGGVAGEGVGGRGYAWQQLVCDRRVRSRDLDRHAARVQRRLHVRPHHCDLRLRDARRRLTERASELHCNLLAHERRQAPEKHERLDVTLAEAPVAGDRLREPEGPPHAPGEIPGHRGAARDLVEGESLLTRTEPAERGDAREPVLLLGLDQLRDAEPEAQQVLEKLEAGRRTG